MDIDAKHLDHLCSLSSLSIDESKKDSFISQIDEIIWFMWKLEDLDVDWVEPLFHPIEDSFMQTNTAQEDKDFTDMFVQNVKHQTKDNWVVIKSAIK